MFGNPQRTIRIPHCANLMHSDLADLRFWISNCQLPAIDVALLWLFFDDPLIYTNGYSYLCAEIGGFSKDNYGRFA